jgi:hypothetical protein
VPFDKFEGFFDTPHSPKASLTTNFLMEVAHREIGTIMALKPCNNSACLVDCGVGPHFRNRSLRVRKEVLFDDLDGRAHRLAIDSTFDGGLGVRAFDGVECPRDPDSSAHGLRAPVGHVVQISARSNPGLQTICEGDPNIIGITGNRQLDRLTARARLGFEQPPKANLVLLDR